MNLYFCCQHSTNLLIGPYGLRGPSVTLTVFGPGGFRAPPVMAVVSINTDFCLLVQVAFVEAKLAIVFTDFSLSFRSLLFTNFGDIQVADYLWALIL